MFRKIEKYAPVAAIVGYAAVYAGKGWNYVLSDIQALTIDKLMAKWQNFAIVVALAVVLAFLKKVGLPREIRIILTFLVYALIGWQLALAIDPPTYNNQTGSRAYANHYAARGH